MTEIMTDLEAIEIIESENPAKVREQLMAYQHLINTGMIWKLKLPFCRTARALLDANILDDPNE
jgi:hypothetical protein